MKSIYTSGEYLESNRTWHVEDSAWKADQISGLLDKNNVHPRLVAEIGCGAGAILSELSQKAGFSDGVRFKGYDISPQAIELANSRSSDRLTFFCEDMFLAAESDVLDVLLVIDVFEHVTDYMGFVSKCRLMATYKVYHIPLDIHVSSVLRNTSDRTRQQLGHLHSFTASSAIATLRDTGHEIVDQYYTDGALGLFKQHPSIKRAMANIPRWLLSQFSVPFTARVLGGYSLLVLAK
jgi:SAM-dependent methyltransferase